MRDVAVVAFSQRQMKEMDGSPTCVELLVPIFGELYEQTGWTKADIDFWCSGSSDYLAGRSFSFVQAVDAIGALPPVMESHVEMDAAWALYEAWVKIQTGEIDTAAVYGFGKASAGVLRRTLALQLDPYTVQPLWADTVSLNGLQAREGLEKGLWDEKAMAEVVARSMTDAAANEWAIRKGATSVDELAPLYRQMLAIRRLEEASAKAYSQGKIGGFLHLIIGQEAVCTGAIAASGISRPKSCRVGAAGVSKRAGRGKRWPMKSCSVPGARSDSAGCVQARESSSSAMPAAPISRLRPSSRGSSGNQAQCGWSRWSTATCTTSHVPCRSGGETAPAAPPATQHAHSGSQRMNREARERRSDGVKGIVRFR